MRNIVKEAAIIIIFITVLIIGVILIGATDEYAREKFGDGTCQSCGDAKYEAITVDRNGYTVYECPECYDSVRINRY
jgi:predicted RNA-binding Zn-ribbon protein involved in translation (DUF1610 family)